MAKNPEMLDVLASTNRGRKPSLLRRKYSMMAAGAFSFYRGANDLFALDWEDLKPLDPGPAILLCGDLHLENFGAYLTDSGDCRFGINDFDEAIVAPAALDLVRCAASIWLAADSWGIGPADAAAIVVAFLDRYRMGVGGSTGSGQAEGVDPATAPDALLALLTPTALASHDELIDRLTVPGKAKSAPTIRTGSGRRRVGPKKLVAIRSAFEALDGGPEPGRSVDVLDATTRVAGLGSLGLRRYLVLVEGGVGERRRRLLDVKEAAPSALARCHGAVRPEGATDEATRVIEAETRINDRPESGLAVVEFGGRHHRARAMVPESNRSSLSRLRRDPARLREAVRSAGEIAARAHVRGARSVDPGREEALIRWAVGPSFDSIMLAAARVADRTGEHFRAFRRQVVRKSVRKRLGLSSKIEAAPAG